MTVPAPQPNGYWTPKTAPRFGNAPNRPPGNTWAWTGLIVSVSGFVFPLLVNGLLGAIFSIFGLREARRLEAAGHTESGRSIAMAGLITGIVHLLVTIGLVVLAVLAFQWFYEWVDTFQQQLIDASVS